MAHAYFQFGPFRLYPTEHLLLRDEQPVPLAPKAFELLLALVSQHGHLVTRESLMQAVWPDSFVEETNLTVNISLLRKVLGEVSEGRPWIATVPKRGYRFDNDVAAEASHNGAVGWQNGTRLVSTMGSNVIATETPPAPPPALAVAIAPDVGPTSPQTSHRNRWFLLSAVLLISAICIWISLRLYGSRHPQQFSSVHTIAVLPFQPTGADSEEQYLGIGLTDALITRLGRLSQIVVRPIGAVRNFTKASDPLAVGRQLNVQAVLKGTVKRAGDRTQVAVNLQRVSDGNVLWSENFDEQNSSDFQIEDSISQRLAKALALRLSSDEQRQLATPNTPNSHAYELYIQGRYNWNKRSVESVQKSIDLFRQATDVDPNYAAAWSGLSDAWILAGSYGNSFLAPSIAMPKAKEAAERALALDPLSAEAHTSLAYIHLMWDWDYAAAEQEFRRAIAINPAYVNAHHWYSHELIALGRVGESHEQSETALALDPSDVVINEHMAWHHMMTREYQRSIPQANKAVELDPNFVQARRVLGLDLLYSEGDRASCDEFEKGVELSHGDPVARAYLARCYAQTHREQEARKILPTLVQASAERYISAAEIAAVYASLNEPESALKWLDKACNEHASTMVYLNADRIWDPLRANTAFQAMVKRVNLTPVIDESSH